MIYNCTYSSPTEVHGSTSVNHASPNTYKIILKVVGAQICIPSNMQTAYDAIFKTHFNAQRVISSGELADSIEITFALDNPVSRNVCNEVFQNFLREGLFISESSGTNLLKNKRPQDIAEAILERLYVLINESVSFRAQQQGWSSFYASIFYKKNMQDHEANKPLSVESPVESLVEASVLYDYIEPILSIDENGKVTLYYTRLMADQGVDEGPHNLAECDPKYVAYNPPTQFHTALYNIGLLFEQVKGILTERELVFAEKCFKLSKLLLDHFDMGLRGEHFYKQISGFMTERNLDPVIVRSYKLAANLGDDEAQFALESYDVRGTGEEKRATESFSHHKLYAEEGSPLAQCRVGYCYEKGIETEADIAEAVKYYRMAADQGAALALFRLGYLFEVGLGVEKSASEAVRHYKLAADKGLALAQVRRGLYFLGGKEVAKDYTEAAKCFRLAADQGSARALYELGLLYKNGLGVAKDDIKAAECFKSAADKGFAKAQYEIGCCYKGGLGVAKDDAEAVRYLKLAAAQGLAEALNYLGRLYAKTVEDHINGIQKNNVTAVKYYKFAAFQGLPEAQRNLGYCYEEGNVVQKSGPAAFRYFKLAASQGSSIAEYELGRCNHFGIGGKVDVKKAAKHYKLCNKKYNDEAKAASDMLGPSRICRI